MAKARDIVPQSNPPEGSAVKPSSAVEPDPEEEEPAGSDVSTEMKQPDQLPERPKISHGLSKGIVLNHGEGTVFNNVTKTFIIRKFKEHLYYYFSFSWFLSFYYSLQHLINLLLLQFFLVINFFLFGNDGKASDSC